jgi:hypothetical protein
MAKSVGFAGRKQISRRSLAGGKVRQILQRAFADGLLCSGDGFWRDF